jgi:hypothetical protein
MQRFLKEVPWYHHDYTCVVEMEIDVLHPSQKGCPRFVYIRMYLILDKFSGRTGGGNYK